MLRMVSIGLENLPKIIDNKENFKQTYLTLWLTLCISELLVQFQRFEFR